MKKEVRKIFAGLCLLLFLLSFFACGVKHKSVSEVKSELEQKSRLKLEQSNTSFNIDYFGGTLSGSWNLPDSSQTDSAEFESEGVKLKLTLKGKTIGFKAEAKPVARSSLQVETKSLDQQQEIKQKQQTKELNKEKTTPTGWGWIAAITILVISFLLIRRALKR